MCVMALRVNDFGFRSSSYHDRENLWQSLSGLECHREEGDKVFNLLIKFDMLVCCGLFGYIYIYIVECIENSFNISIRVRFCQILIGFWRSAECVSSYRFCVYVKSEVSSKFS